MISRNIKSFKIIVIEYDINDIDAFAAALKKADELRNQGKNVVLNHN